MGYYSTSTTKTNTATTNTADQTPINVKDLHVDTQGAGRGTLDLAAVLNEVQDEFPFYLIKIKKFAQILDDLADDDEGLQCTLRSTYAPIENIRSAFCLSRAWEEKWATFEGLLHTYMFKENLMNDNSDDLLKKTSGFLKY
jgi:hypothetical protein